MTEITPESEPDVSTAAYRLRLAWVRRKLAVSEALLGLRIGVAQALLPSGYAIWTQSAPGSFVEIDVEGHDAFGI